MMPAQSRNCQNATTVPCADTENRLPPSAEFQEAGLLTNDTNSGHLPFLSRKLLEGCSLPDEVVSAREQRSHCDSFQNVVSKNARMFAIFDLIGRVAET